MTAGVTHGSQDRYRSLLGACLAAQTLVDRGLQTLGYYTMRGWEPVTADVLKAKADHIEYQALAREYRAARPAPAIVGAA